MNNETPTTPSTWPEPPFAIKKKEGSDTALFGGFLTSIGWVFKSYLVSPPNDAEYTVFYYVIHDECDGGCRYGAIPMHHEDLVLYEAQPGDWTPHWPLLDTSGAVDGGYQLTDNIFARVPERYDPSAWRLALELPPVWIQQQ